MPSQNPVRRLLAATLLLAIAGAPFGAFAQQPKGKPEAAAAASCSGHEVIVLRGPEAPIRAAVAAVGVATKP